MDIKRPVKRIELAVQILRKFGTQENFAFAADEHSSFVSRAVSGHRKVNDDRKKRWARVLQCDVKDIFPEA
jgi:hypothetical protein